MSGGMSANRKVTVVIADDHPVIREGVRRLLEKSEDIDIIGEAGNGIDAVAMTEALRPDILILDVQLPRLSGIEVIQALKRDEIDCNILIFSVINDPFFEEETLCSGACQYVVKDEPESLIDAIHQAVAGECQQPAPCSPQGSGALVYEFKTQRKRID